MSTRMFGVLSFSAAFLLTARAAPAQEQPAPTRIAVVNLGEVFLNYARTKDGKKALEAALAPYKKLSDQLQADSVRLQQVVVDPKVDAEEKNAANKKLVAIRRQQEDLNLESQKVFGKKNEQHFIDLYSDVEAAIQRHADAHNIDLVLAYGEPLNKEDRLKFPNVSRKMNGAEFGGAVPIFIRPRIDITQAVLKSLNDAYSSKK
jgi:Skp family chaperone for outer membrane proteins